MPAEDIVQTISIQGADEAAAAFNEVSKAGSDAFKQLAASAQTWGQALTRNVADFFGAIHEQIAAAREAQEELGKAAASQGPGGFLQGFLGGLTVEGLHQITGVIGGAVAAVGHMVESMQQLSASTGVSVEDLSSLQGVLAGSGLSADKFAAAFKKMNESAVEDTHRVRKAVEDRAISEQEAVLAVQRAREKYEAVTYGRQPDPTTVQLRQQKEAALELQRAQERQRQLQDVSPVQRQVERITQAAAGLTGIPRQNAIIDMLREIPDAATRAGASMQTLKRELTTLEFEKGSAGVEALRQRIRELGATLTETETRDLTKFREGMAATGQSITVLAAKFVAGMLRPFAKELEDGSSALDRFAKSAAAVGEAFGKMVHDLSASTKNLRTDPSWKTLTEFLFGPAGQRGGGAPSEREIVNRMRRQQGLEPLPPEAPAPAEVKPAEPSKGFKTETDVEREIRERREKGEPGFTSVPSVKPAEGAAAPAKEAADGLQNVAEPANNAAAALQNMVTAIDGAIGKLGELLGVPRPAPAEGAPAPAAAKAGGGLIGGWGGPKSDSVPIMASKGEFIVAADGRNLDDALAHFGLKGYAEGGLITSSTVMGPGQSGQFASAADRRQAEQRQREAQKQAEAERGQAEAAARAREQRRQKVVERLEQLFGRDPMTGQLPIAAYDVVRGFANGGLVGAFTGAVSRVGSSPHGAPVPTGAGANVLGYHQLDLRTSAGTFSVAASADTMNALRTSSLAGKLAQTGQRPSWYS